MKVLTAIFSREANLAYLKVCLEYWDRARQKSLLKVATKIDLLILDFSSQPSAGVRDLAFQHDGVLGQEPKGGFGHNFNFARFWALTCNYDYMFCLNDDTAISDIFIDRGINFLEAHQDAGFVGGEQTPGGWGLALNSLLILPERQYEYEITDVKRLWWEVSAGFWRCQALRGVGPYDEEFDPTGYIADGLYLLRLKQKSWSCWHSGRMQYWHGKGITQSDYRFPKAAGEPDPIRDRAIKIAKEKWGVDWNADRVERLAFTKPYGS